MINLAHVLPIVPSPNTPQTTGELEVNGVDCETAAAGGEAIQSVRAQGGDTEEPHCVFLLKTSQLSAPVEIVLGASEARAIRAQHRKLKQAKVATALRQAGGIYFVICAEVFYLCL